MKITGIKVYQVDLPLGEGNYSWSEGKSVDVFDSTLVEINTDTGLCGVGEICPLGPFYLPAFGPGARTAIAELAPHLLGQDPREIGRINQIMDETKEEGYRAQDILTEIIAAHFPPHHVQ